MIVHHETTQPATFIDSDGRQIPTVATIRVPVDIDHLGGVLVIDISRVDDDRLILTTENAHRLADFIAQEFPR